MILASLLRAYISVNDLSIRKVADQIGIKHNNLWRIMQGENTRADNVLRIVAWLLTESLDQLPLEEQRALNDTETEPLVTECAQKDECPLSPVSDSPLTPPYQPNHHD